MRYRFDDSNIITCYIKELLHSFNLPRVPVWTQELEDNGSVYEGRTYIKDGLIAKYENGKFNKISRYIYNYPVVNFTKNFIIKSSVYDHYTHEYLGNYLRFIRDYHGIDLMGLYNCFSGKEPSRMLLVDDNGDQGVKIGLGDFKYTIDTDNSEFNYYIVPVKFDKTYTIALNVNSGFDLACILYGDIFISSTPDELIKQSYKHIGGSMFSNPFTYSTKWACTKDLGLWKREKDLKLVLKLPKNIETSIVILEGDYSISGDTVDGLFYADIVDNAEENSKVLKNFYSKLSLLNVNDNILHPFSDKLVEYLLRNVITSNEFIPQNVERVQELVYTTGVQGYYGIWDDSLRYNIYNRALKQDLLNGSNKKYSNTILEYSNNGAINLGVGVKIKYLFIAPNHYTLIPNPSDPKEMIKIYRNILPGEQLELKDDMDFFLQYSDSKDSSGKDIWISCGSLSGGFVVNNLLTVPILNMYNVESFNPKPGGDAPEDYPTKFPYTTVEIKKQESLQVSEVESIKKEIRFIDTHSDVFGYVDRDTETLLKLQYNQGAK